MKAHLLLLPCLLLSLPVHAGTVRPKDFRHSAPVRGMLLPNQPAALPLPSAILAASRHNLDDVRLFDDQGVETPWVMYPCAGRREDPTPVTLKILSYDESKTEASIVLQTPDNTPALARLDIDAAGTDFQKIVTLSASQDGKKWRVVAEDTIFDFSSRIDLRRTRIDFTPVSESRLRLTLRNSPLATSEGDSLHLKYRDLEFTATSRGTKTAPFRIQAVRGWTGETRDEKPVYDQVSFPKPVSVQTPNNSSVIALGEWNRPLDQLVFDIETPYFRRTVEIWTAPDNKPEAWSLAASGTVYRVVGMATPAAVITPHLPQVRWVKIVIQNADSPPLRIRNLDAAWYRRILYFVPEPDRAYTLHVGADVAAPVYDLASLLPNTTALVYLPSLSLGPIVTGKSAISWRNAVVNNAGAWGIYVCIALLIAGLGAWCFSLLKKMGA